MDCIKNILLGLMLWFFLSTWIWGTETILEDKVVIASIDSTPITYADIKPMVTLFLPFYHQLQVPNPTANCINDVADQYISIHVIKMITMQKFTPNNRDEVQTGLPSITSIETLKNAIQNGCYYKEGIVQSKSLISKLQQEKKAITSLSILKYSAVASEAYPDQIVSSTENMTIPLAVSENNTCTQSICSFQWHITPVIRSGIVVNPLGVSDPSIPTLNQILLGVQGQIMFPIADQIYYTKGGASYTFNQRSVWDKGDYSNLNIQVGQQINNLWGGKSDIKLTWSQNRYQMSEADDRLLVGVASQLTQLALDGEYGRQHYALDFFYGMDKSNEGSFLNSAKVTFLSCISLDRMGELGGDLGYRMLQYPQRVTENFTATALGLTWKSPVFFGNTFLIGERIHFLSNHFFQKQYFANYNIKLSNFQLQATANSDRFIYNPPLLVEQIWTYHVIVSFYLNSTYRFFIDFDNKILDSDIRSGLHFFTIFSGLEVHI